MRLALDKGLLSEMIPATLLILPLAVYLLTLCPTVYFGDSGELTVAAFALGIPHASGYPLYALIGKGFCLLPFGNVAFRTNLMSAFFAAAAAWLVYSLVLKMSSSWIGGLVAGLVLAFTPPLWMQTVCAEVYSLHVFLVALLLRVLWWWDEKREFRSLLAFVFLAGLSFGNHLQTVMMAPGVLWIVLRGEGERFFNLKRLLTVTVCFTVPLLIYLYLPIRTWAGAAIHWGDPDSLDRFLTHVMGSAHRASYVFNLTWSEYGTRAEEGISALVSEFGGVLIFAAWGWLNLRPKRWKVFFALVVSCDLFYTVFMNTVSLEITPFNLMSTVVVAALAGCGVGQVLGFLQRYERIGTGTQRIVAGACCCIPIVPLILNFNLCDQSRNYSAYEQTVNIFRTMNGGHVLFVNGDNYIFPLTYGRIIEKMGEHVTVYDRLSLIFKMPDVRFHSGPRPSAWEQGRNRREKSILDERRCDGVFFAVFGPRSVELPDGCTLVPYGTLYKALTEGSSFDPMAGDIWRHYSAESFSDTLSRDYMNREMAAYFHFFHGMALILSGEIPSGLKAMKRASEVGYNDELIHSDMGVFLTDHGFFEEARLSLQRALLYHEDLSGVYNNWGYYYHRLGDRENAVRSFGKAVDLKPDRFGFLNNLGFALFEAGRKEEASHVFERSLLLNENQPEVRKFVRENSLGGSPGS